MRALVLYCLSHLFSDVVWGLPPMGTQPKFAIVVSDDNDNDNDNNNNDQVPMAPVYINPAALEELQKLGLSQGITVPSEYLPPNAKGEGNAEQQSAQQKQAYQSPPVDYTKYLPVDSEGKPVEVPGQAQGKEGVMDVPKDQVQKSESDTVGPKEPPPPTPPTGPSTNDNKANVTAINSDINGIAKPMDETSAMGTNPIDPNTMNDDHLPFASEKDSSSSFKTKSAERESSQGESPHPFGTFFYIGGALCVMVLVGTLIMAKIKKKNEYAPPTPSTPEASKFGRMDTNHYGGTTPSFGRGTPRAFGDGTPKEFGTPTNYTDGVTPKECVTML